MNKFVLAMLSALTGVTVGAGAVGKVTWREIEQIKTVSDKHLALFRMMDHWVQVKQEEKSLASYFKTNGYKKIAIYGLSYAGNTLINELKNTDITVAYGIDRNADSIFADIDIVSADGKLEEVDVIVVTAITFFEEIEEKLSAKIGCPIVSLEDILYEV